MNTSTLSKEQLYAFDKFTKGENLFITGPGGTGKTKLIHHFVKYLKLTRTPYQVCAMTGCASLLLKCNARTLHSWSGIKLGKGPIETIISQVMKNKSARSSWKKIKILIVDEVSMMSKKIFELCDRIARYLRKCDAPFGGIQVIFTGDFFQLPPVGGDSDESANMFSFQSEKWFDVFPLKNNIQLTTMFRQQDPVYIDILLQIRKGEISPEAVELLKPYVKRPIENTTTPTKLFSVRSKVDYVNNAMFNMLEQDEMVYQSIEKTDAKTFVDTNKPIDHAILLKCQELSAHELKFELESISKNVEKEIKLKKGANVMCTFNIDLENGICNGSQGIIEDFTFTPDCEGLMPIVRFNNGIKRIITYQYYQHEEYPTIMVGQLPLCLAWALTIHKIQGTTLDCADMNLGNSVFEYGQSYVALSRIKSLDGLYLSDFQPNRIKAHPLVKQFYDTLLNIDERELLSVESDTLTIAASHAASSRKDSPKGEDSNSSHDGNNNNENIFKDFECDSDTTIKKIRL